MAELHAYPDPHGYGRLGRCCEDSACSLCRSAGLEWKSGFCLRGRWSPKPVEMQAPMDADVWSKLPRDILGNIFVRLPTDGIGRVRCLSKEWRLATSSCSKFTQECAKLHLDLWAMVGFRDGPALTCWVRAYDAKACKWHAFGIESIPQLYRNAIRIFDVGLACFVPCGLGEDHQPVLVCNPLTREWRQLPLSRVVGNQPRMAQLRVDREKGTYQVVVVGHFGVAADVKSCREENNPLPVEVYDSETKMWSPMVSGKVLGFTYWWFAKSLNPMSMRLGLFDCCTGVLAEFYEQFPRRPHRDSDGEVHGYWDELSFAHHLNDLYLLESYFDQDPDQEHSEETDVTLYSVLKHEEGNWGLGTHGPDEARTAPNEIMKLNMVKPSISGHLRIM
ncbi:hypothetical protein KC19_VG276000 [Ceratodon purpureus]|uniref:F-box domain-containing protein n=1 Tax=Ceratodon purpureus TaxID=3225 RepID=A0A8T0HUY3_CERPU|nr:hypothetical protein KC19_VG276000 [Ceratodon purpureus]